MRKVTKDFDAVPPILRSSACEALVADALLTKGKHDFKKKIYGHSEVRSALNSIYHSKCAFCETDTSPGAPMQVEHYRPKAKVTGVRAHPGYYWLGYEWSNLLLACSSCNSRKRNRFPITGIRAEIAPLAGASLDTARCRVDSAELLGEDPYLINPEVDADPMRHFRFQADGTMQYRTIEGKQSIEDYNLMRDPLVLERKEVVYDWVLNQIIRDFDNFNDSKCGQSELMYSLKMTILDLGLYSVDPKKQYTEFAKTCWKKFNDFFIVLFQSQERKKLQEAYDEVKAELATV